MKSIEINIEITTVEIKVSRCGSGKYLVGKLMGSCGSPIKPF